MESSSSSQIPKVVIVYRDPKSHPQPLFDTLSKLEGEAFNSETLIW